MFVIRVILATISLRVLEAIIVDTYYMPSQTKEQVDTVAFQKVNKPREKPKDVYDHYVKPLYKYGYSVFDPYTLDVKSQWEHRDGDFVKGAYNMLEADGSMRIVEYTSDKDTGFQAVVKNIPYYLDKNQSPVETFPKYNKSKNKFQGQSSEVQYQDDKIQYPVNNIQQSVGKIQYPVDKHQYHHPSVEKYQLKSNVPLTQNYIQRENYYKQYQNKVRSQHPTKKYKRYLHDS